MAKAHFLRPLLGHDAGSATLLIERVGAKAPLATTLEMAVDSGARKRGLLGRDALEPGTALVIAPTNGVHTFFMRFTIDVVFVTRDGRVVKIARRVRPWRIALAPKAFAVVELAAGSADRAGLIVGDQLKVLVEHSADHATS